MRVRVWGSKEASEGERGGENAVFMQEKHLFCMIGKEFVSLQVK